MGFFIFLVLNTILMFVLLGLTFSFFQTFKGVSRQRKDDSAPLPFVSIVVPARNESVKIERCLESLLMQDYPHFEVIVIDDRSTDNTGEIIDRLVSEYQHLIPVKCQYSKPGWLGKCNA